MDEIKPLSFAVRRAPERERAGSIVLEATIGEGVVELTFDAFGPDAIDPSVAFTSGTIGCADTKAGAKATAAIATWLGVDAGKKKPRLRKAQPATTSVVVLAFDPSGELGSKLRFEDGDIEVYFNVTAGWTRGELALKSDALVELAAAFACALRDGPDHDAGIRRLVSFSPLTVDGVLQMLCDGCDAEALARDALPPIADVRAEILRRFDAGERNGFFYVNAVRLLDAHGDPSAVDLVCRGLAHRVGRIHVLVWLLGIFHPRLRPPDPAQRARVEHDPIAAALDATLAVILAGADATERAHRSEQVAKILAVWNAPTVDPIWERLRDTREPVVLAWYAVWATRRIHTDAARWAAKRALSLAERSDLDDPRKATVAVAVANALRALAALPSTAAERQADHATWTAAAAIWPKLGPRPTQSRSDD